MSYVNIFKTRYRCTTLGMEIPEFQLASTKGRAHLFVQGVPWIKCSFVRHFSSSLSFSVKSLAGESSSQSYVDDVSDIVLQNWHKLLGLRGVAKSHSPELLLSFKIEESLANNDVSTALVKVVSPLEPEVKKVNHKEHHFLQIGPPESNELYELFISIQEAGNLYSVIPPSDIGAPITFQYSVLGSSFFSDDFGGLSDNITSSVNAIEVKAQAAFLASYFQGFPQLTFKLYCGVNILGSATLDLHELSTFSNSKPFVKKAKLFIQTLDEKIDEGELSAPFMKVEVSLISKNVKCYEDSFKQMFETFNVDAVSGEALIGDSALSAQNSPPSPTPSPCKVATNPEPEFCMDEIVEGDFLSVHLPANVQPEVQPQKEPEIKGQDRSSTELSLFYQSKKAVDRSKGSTGTDLLPRQYIREAALKTCEELEDWKEKQQEIFKYELTLKTEKHLKRLSDEWVKEKRELENLLKHKVKSCEMLFRKLEDTISELVVRSERISIREEETYKAKEDLDKKYSIKFQELRKASQLHQFDMEEKVHSIALEKTSLAAKLEEREREIAQLKEALAQNSGEVSKQQILSLNEEMRLLKLNLEKALRSKSFFKEQWAKALREFHLLKEQEKEDMKNVVRRSKQEVDSVGLVYGITKEVDEMRLDQLELKRLKEEIRSRAESRQESNLSFYSPQFQTAK